MTLGHICYNWTQFDNRAQMKQAEILETQSAMAAQIMAECR